MCLLMGCSKHIYYCITNISSCAFTQDNMYFTIIQMD